VAKSTWRKAGNECFTPIHGGVKNYNEVPTDGELLPGGAPSRVVLSSVGTKWNDVVLEQRLTVSRW
jgi:hypothetical protein